MARRRRALAARPRAPRRRCRCGSPRPSSRRRGGRACRDRPRPRECPERAARPLACWRSCSPPSGRSSAPMCSSSIRADPVFGGGRVPGGRAAGGTCRQQEDVPGRHHRRWDAAGRPDAGRLRRGHRSAPWPARPAAVWPGARSPGCGFGVTRRKGLCSRHAAGLETSRASRSSGRWAGRAVRPQGAAPPPALPDRLPASCGPSQGPTLCCGPLPHAGRERGRPTRPEFAAVLRGCRRRAPGVERADLASLPRPAEAGDAVRAAAPP